MSTTTEHRLTLTATRGLPASGKTTWARERLAEDTTGRLARCNRDDLRRMLHTTPRYNTVSDALITIVQHNMIRTLLRCHISVIVDDTNLDLTTVEALQAIAAQQHADFSLISFTDIPATVCIERDAAREGDRRVGAPVIRDMQRRYLVGSLL
jgi:predicted kinase